jgi:AAA+ superfamily predicted ATPase
VTPGFALTERQWCWFSVDLIRSVEFNTEAFEKLLLPPAQKRLLLALVENHISNGDGFDDLIEGKGKGLVFALHGEPGVGKTFTVESLADRVERPLYVLMTGELGLTPTSVELNLNKALSLAVAWNAIVLIDEADVFMAQRTAQDLTRNSLVSSQLLPLSNLHSEVKLTI